MDKLSAALFLVLIASARLFGAIPSPTAQPGPEPRPAKPIICLFAPVLCEVRPQPVEPKPKPIEPKACH